jgi:copper transport protein
LSIFASKSGFWLGLLLLLAGLSWPRPVLAHAGLVKSLPADLCTSLESQLSPGSPECATGQILSSPPDSLHLWFSEPVQTVRRSIMITTSSGSQLAPALVQLNDRELMVTLNLTEQGTYLVNWRVLSGDTHPVRGQFAFSVGRASPLINISDSSSQEVGRVSALGLALQVVARWLHFCGYALSFGPLVFWRTVLGLQANPLAERRLWRLVGLGIGLLLLAEPLALLGQTASLSPAQVFDPDVIGDVLASNFGPVLAQHLGAAILLWVLSGLVRELGVARLSVIGLGIGLVLALADGQASHAITSNPVWFSLLINALHLAAMGMWVGGLASLLLVWPLKETGRKPAELVSRFGKIAGISLALLIVTGLIMTWQHLNRPSDLLQQNYGLALTLKLALLLLTVALAWQGRKTEWKPQRARWWRLEALALLAVLVIAGLLVSLPSPA